jgi:hypothetical protein
MAERAFLLAQAARFRRLAQEIMDSKTEDTLLALADEYEQRAAAIEENTSDLAHSAQSGARCEQ